MTRSTRQNKRHYIAAACMIASIIAGGCIFSGCTGRTADNMKPLGETVEVVIPVEDIEQDSVIANFPEQDSPVAI